MLINPQTIFLVLDSCCDNFAFPMLDNGYFYLAAARLSLYRTAVDWAMVIETFGYSPRSALPVTCIYSFASTICDRSIPDGYGPTEISNLYARNPNNDMRFVFPIEPGEWQEKDEYCIAEGIAHVVVRGQRQAIPSLEQFAPRGISLERPPRIQVFELCRFLSDEIRELVLATPEERRSSIGPGLVQVLQLDEWHHPNVVDGKERPSKTQTFQQLAQVLATGDPDLYQPSEPPNTHWRNWPECGSL